MSNLYRIEYTNLEYDSDSFTYITASSLVEASRKFKEIFLNKLKPKEIKEVKYEKSRKTGVGYIISTGERFPSKLQPPVC